jgi:hypothetical protein
MEGTSVEEVWRFYGPMYISSRSYQNEVQNQSFVATGIHTSAGFERVGAEGEHIGRETGLKEDVFIRR